MEEIKKEIVEILDKNEFPLTQTDIQKELNNRINLEEICNILIELEKNGSIYATKKGKYTLYKYTHLKTGRLSVSKAGYGFVLLEGEPDMYIKKENMNGALYNDMVVAEYINNDEGKIIKIIDRSFDTIVGEFILEDDKKGKVIVDDPRLKIEIVIDEEHRNNAMDGDKVVVKPYTEIGNNRFYGEITKILGNKNEPGIDILSIVYTHDIEPEFSEDTIKELDDIPFEINGEEIIGRRDVRDEKIITMDGDDAKDFDDAIGIKKLQNGNYLLSVHIADVTNYVKEGTALYNDAKERATSVYLVDRVIPMLPTKLSNGICSLNPNVDRLTLACDMEIDEHGKVVDFDVYEAVINSKMRMTYKKANMFLKKGIVPEGYENFTEELTNMFELSKILRRMKTERGNLEFDVPEIKIIVDEAGIPTEIKERERGTGEKLIEDFMIAANETVAEYITNVGYPMMYRIHEIPDEKKIREYLMLLNALGHKPKIDGKLSNIRPKQMQTLLNGLKDSSDYDMLSELGLRSMKKAIYSTENKGHFGLASRCYCHFTSPIRRWPDDTVHMVVKKILHGEELSGKDLIALEKTLSLEAEHSSQKERASVECERDVDDMKMAEYMMNHIGEEFTGKVSGVIPSGMFVRLPNLIEGRVHIGSITGDYYIVDEKTQMIVGKRSGIRYRLGDTVNVKVVNASKVEGTIDFELIVKKVNHENEKES